MTYTKDSPILGKGALLTHEAMSWVRDRRDNKQSWPESVNGQPFWEFIGDYVLELERLCYLIGFDFGLLFSQFCHESDDASSPIFLARGNGIGLGVTDGGDDGITFQNGTDAARAHIAHMRVYVYGDQVLREPANSEAGPDDDPRWNNVILASWDGTVRTLNDLTGKWATDPTYGEEIAAKANAVLAATKGVSVNPVIYNLSSDYARFGLSQEDAMTILGYRFTNRTWAGVKGSADYLFFHLQDGNTRSSLDWWANGYIGPVKVTASSHYMVQRDGSILRVIEESHAAWTNGDDNRPTPAGAPVVALPGNTNLWTVTIEAEGTPGDPPTNYPAQMDALEWLARDIMKRNPNCAKRGHQLRHADVNSVTRPNCPGAYYVPIMARIEDAIVDDGEPAEPQPAPIWWDKDDVGGQKRPGDGAVAYAFYGEVTALRKVPLYASVGGVKVAEMKLGEKAIIRGTYLQPNGDKKPIPWAFISWDPTHPEKVGRARLSAFFPKWPTV